MLAGVPAGVDAGVLAGVDVVVLAGVDVVDAGVLAVVDEPWYVDALAGEDAGWEADWEAVRPGAPRPPDADAAGEEICAAGD